MLLKRLPCVFSRSTNAFMVYCNCKETLVCCYLTCKKGNRENSGSNIVKVAGLIQVSGRGRKGRGGEGAQWVKHLPHKCEDVSSNPQDP